MPDPPAAWPQVPYDDPPPTPERSPARYPIHEETDLRLRLRDGCHIAYDVFRPGASGLRFPALIACSAYGRKVQRTSVPIPQNEAGITSFWVPRGYAHVIADVRGSSDSEGDWDFWGPVEQQDIAELIEHIAAQPWCDGSAGMIGISYFGIVQNLVARLRPPSLKAIFPLDSFTDLYRECLFHGGIPADGFAREWGSALTVLNSWSGRRREIQGIERHLRRVVGLYEPFDGRYYQERSAWPDLERATVPAYFGSSWPYVDLHLRGAFVGYERTGAAAKRLLVGPGPVPKRPFANLHLEALRWYDQWLKGMDTRVMDGDPIRLWVQGERRWRGEREWPLARTEWRRLYLEAGSLSDTPGRAGARTYEYRPEREEEWIRGEPRLVYRSAALDTELEVTGPITLTLWASITAADTDWIAWLFDEAPDGSREVLTKGWLRASHRGLDDDLTTPWRPWHPHTPESMRPVPANQAVEYAIEVLPASNVFRPGHRIRLEISSCDPVHITGRWSNRGRLLASDNTVLEGGDHASHLVLPVIPR